MIILFSPAKEMLESHPIAQNGPSNSVVSTIVSQFYKMSRKELKQLWKLEGEAFERAYFCIQNYEKLPFYEALSLYHGLSYRTMEHETFSNPVPPFLDQHLRIFSALYGPISPSTPIKPYRLDFTMGLKVEGKTLKSLWKKELPHILSPEEEIWNLASNEFSSLFGKEYKNWLDFSFFEEKEGKRKKHSTISKKGRGLMVKYIAENEITEREALKDFSLDSYEFLPEESNQNHYIYIKKEDRL